MKKFFLGIACVCGIVLTAADPFFHTAVKHVDTGGEMLMYQNLTTMMFVLDRQLPNFLIQLAAADEDGKVSPELVKKGADVAMKLLDLMSFRAMAASSSEVAHRRFVYKSFTVISPESRSVLVNREAKNRPVNVLDLPFDTRFALSLDIAPGAVWQQVKAEIAAAATPELSNLVSAVESLKEEGIDVDSLLGSMSGELFILITGDSLENLGVRIDLPDRDGKLGAQLKTILPPAEGSNAAPLQLPVPAGAPQVVYAPGKVQLVSDMKMLAAPEKTLAKRAVYAKYAKFLPAEGTDYFVVDIPKSLTDLGNTLIEAQSEGTMALRLKPLFFAAVNRRTPEGIAGVAVSNFSLFRLQSTLPLAQMSTLLPMLQKARDKAKTVKGTGDMKELGIALQVYAADHDGVLPPRNGKAGLQALKELVSDEDILNDKIFIGGGVKISAEQAPSLFPVAFDAPGSVANRVNILFLDGHVEVIELENYTDAEQVIGVLNQKTKRSPEQLKDLLRRVGENK
ncbi:MAG: hypothetical protein MR051_09560 [Lentisphaeria bacterium]|nr:hypothetical protein [Lentisphaeria bacterium]